MKLFLNPSLEAKALLGLCCPYSERTSGFPNAMTACAPFHLSACMEYVPASLPGSARARLDAAYQSIPASMTTIQLPPRRGITEEDQPERRIVKFMLANRPMFKAGSGITQLGDFSDMQSSYLLNKDGQLRSRVSPTEDTYETHVNRVYLEQSLMTSAQIDVRNGGPNQSDSRGKRQANEGPIVCALLPCAMATLAMKEAPNTLKLRLEAVGRRGAAVRTATSTTVNDVIGWAGGYDLGHNSGDHDGGRYDDPDGPESSMNYGRMWHEDAGIVRLYPARGRYTGKYCWSRKANVRDTERDSVDGDFDMERSAVQDVLNWDYDYQPQDLAISTGMVCSASTDSAQPPEGDTPQNLTNIETSAIADLMQDAVKRVVRNFLIGLIVSADPQFASPVDGLEDSLHDLWWNAQWSPDKLQVMKSLLFEHPYAKMMYDGAVSLGGLVYGHYGSIRLGTPASVRKAGAQESFAALGSVSYDISQTELKPIASPFVAMGNSQAWATATAPNLHSFSYSLQGRALVGASTAEGSWAAAAILRHGGISALYTADDLAKTLGGHLVPADVNHPPIAAYSALGLPYATEPELVGSSICYTTGAALEIESNGVSGQFEGWDDSSTEEFEYDVSDWNEGGSFFVFFMTNGRRS